MNGTEIFVSNILHRCAADCGYANTDAHSNVHLEHAHSYTDQNSDQNT
jgi:hypothetical protein